MNLRGVLWSHELSAQVTGELRARAVSESVRTSLSVQPATTSESPFQNIRMEECGLFSLIPKRTWLQSEDGAVFQLLVFEIHISTTFNSFAYLH